MKPFLDENFNLFFEITPEEKTHLLSDYSEIYNKYEPFEKWMNNPEVSLEDKKIYEDKFIQAMHSLSFLFRLLKMSGIPEKEILEYQEIPF